VKTPFKPPGKLNTRGSRSGQCRKTSKPLLAFLLGWNDLCDAS